MGRVTKKQKPNNYILNADADVQAACESLREHVDNLNRRPAIQLVGTVYRSKNAEQIQTVKISGVEIGYRMQWFNTFMRRQIFVKVPSYRIDDLSKSERERIMTAVFNVFLVAGAALPEVGQIAPDCMLLQQNIVPMVLTEREPRLVDIAGGFDA